MSEETERDPQARLEHWSRLLRGERISELHALTEAQVIEQHDALVEEARRSNKPAPAAKLQWLERAQVYADELARREMVRQGERMEALTRSLNRLTWWIVVLTVLIAIATLVGVGLTAAALLLGG
jgi:hypothetical protein